jgi:hypothetical protein
MATEATPRESRIRTYTRDGAAAYVEVNILGCVVITEEALHALMTDAGWGETTDTKESAP